MDITPDADDVVTDEIKQKAARWLIELTTSDQLVGPKARPSHGLSTSRAGVADYGRRLGFAAEGVAAPQGLGGDFDVCTGMD